MQDIKKVTILIAMAVIGALSLLGFWWFFFGSKSGFGMEFEPITVEVEAVRRGSIVRRVTVVGTLRADNEVVIKPEIEGKIKKINFEGGNLVQKGDPLVEIEDDTYKAQVKDAEATLSFAEADYSRYERLAQQAAGPAKLKEKALAEKLQAEARLELAKIKLQNTVIRAPFTGIVGLKQYSVGSFVTPQVELLSVVDVDPIKLDFRLPAVYLQSISRGQEVKVTIDSMPDEIFRAKIDAIDPKVDATANSVLVRAVIPNPRAVLKPGLFARVNLVVGAKDNTLLVPETAVLSRVEEEYVYRVVEVPINGVPTKVVLRTPITTGLSEGGVIEVARGLNEGDQVVTVGLSKVRDRYPVRIVEDAEAEESMEGDEDKSLGDEKQTQSPASAKTEEETTEPTPSKESDAESVEDKGDFAAEKEATEPVTEQPSADPKQTEESDTEATEDKEPAAAEKESTEQPSEQQKSAQTDKEKADTSQTSEQTSEQKNSQKPEEETTEQPSTVEKEKSQAVVPKETENKEEGE